MKTVGKTRWKEIEKLFVHRIFANQKRVDEFLKFNPFESLFNDFGAELWLDLRHHWLPTPRSYTLPETTSCRMCTSSCIRSRGHKRHMFVA